MSIDKPKVYLAGIISGASYGDAIGWREWAAKELALAGITGASPMRWKSHLNDEDVLDPMGYSGNVLSAPKGIITRDRWDVMTCDLIIANLLHAEKVSIGTVMEIAWADLLRKPIITVMEDDNIHHHCMLNPASGFIVPTLDDAVRIAKRILIYE